MTKGIPVSKILFTNAIVPWSFEPLIKLVRIRVFTVGNPASNALFNEANASGTGNAWPFGYKMALISFTTTGMTILFIISVEYVTRFATNVAGGLGKGLAHGHSCGTHFEGDWTQEANDKLEGDITGIGPGGP
jgi:hypothetical protein